MKNNILNGALPDDGLTLDNPRCNSVADLVSGTPRDDGLAGTGNRDRIFGGGGHDWVMGLGGSDQLHGGNGHDDLYGDNGADKLFGDRGSDFLSGGGGHDVLRGGKGRDVFDAVGLARWDYPHSSDRFVDFVKGKDIILLTFYDRVDHGALNPAIFVASATGKALDADDCILYETDTGKLSYDPDGNGAHDKILLAIVGTKTHPKLDATDFLADSLLEPPP